jgi:hypothetical protein
MSTYSASKAPSVLPTISELLEVCKLDTLYRDLYFQRARELLGTLLNYSGYVSLKEGVASIPWLEQQLRAAVEKSDWQRSGELTGRIRTLKDRARDNAELIKFGESVYEELADVPIDPFSPGFHVFVRGSKEQLTDWRNRAIRILSSLERADPPKKEFYARRGADFRALGIKTPTADQEEKSAASDHTQLQQDALDFLDSGDLSNLESVIQKMMQKSETTEVKKETTSTTKVEDAPELGNDLLFTFSQATLDAAKQLGLAPARTNSRRQFAYLMPLGWQPRFMKDDVRKYSKEQLSRLTYPSTSGDKAKEAIEFYLLNPFITSGGTRYQVCLVAEDLLLEDFPDPEPREMLPRTELLKELGLETRWGLSRLEVENTLVEHGPRILKEKLGLDPEAFRLVAVPADIYTHLAADRGWGQKEMWTHFDGYRVLEGGKLQALAGGDKRFGGTHDVVSFAPAYNNDKVLARFAVVQRKRMMTWHHAN